MIKRTKSDERGAVVIITAISMLMVMASQFVLKVSWEVILTPVTYAVAALPTGTAGAMVFASDGRKAGEGAGAGTGVLTVYSNGAWRRLSDDSAVVA